MGHPSLEFLFRAWSMPSGRDVGLLVILGVVNSFGGYAISQAYRLSEAALVAPFEYVAMPLAVFWGFAIFGEWPAPVAWAGIALILASGLFLIWREAMLRRRIIVRR
jgi:drug/metabolite transporter (DMT)-like permease